MHRPEAAQENEMRKLHWDFQISADHKIRAKRRDNFKKREFAAGCTLSFRRTTVGKSKKTKRGKSTWTLPENEENLEPGG